jgi:hypothetical protein
VVFGVVKSCGLVNRKRFGGTYCLHLYGSGAAGGLLIALMMVAKNTSETSVYFYQTTRRYNPEDILAAVRT